MFGMHEHILYEAAMNNCFVTLYYSLQDSYVRGSEGPLYCLALMSHNITLHASG